MFRKMKKRGSENKTYQRCLLLGIVHSCTTFEIVMDVFDFRVMLGLRPFFIALREWQIFSWTHVVSQIVRIRWRPWWRTSFNQIERLKWFLKCRTQKIFWLGWAGVRRKIGNWEVKRKNLEDEGTWRVEKRQASSIRSVLSLNGPDIPFVVSQTRADWHLSAY